jgi:hypothetical protein
MYHNEYQMHLNSRVRIYIKLYIALYKKSNAGLRIPLAKSILLPKHTHASDN